MNAVTLGLIQHRVVYNVTDTSWKLRNVYTYVYNDMYIYIYLYIFFIYIYIYIYTYIGPRKTNDRITGRMLIHGVVSTGNGAP